MSFQDDIQELFHAGYDVSRIRTESYAHRLAQGVRAATAEGRTAPGKAELRGHQRSIISQIPADGKRKEATELMATHPKSKAAKSQLQAEDLQKLKNKAPTPGPKETFRVVIKGKVSKYPGMAPIPQNKPVKQTVSFLLSPKSLQNYLDKNPTATVQDFANQFYGPRHGTDWTQVTSVLLIVEDKPHA